MRKPLSEEQLKALEMIENGQSISSVARLFGVSRPTVYTWLENKAGVKADYELAIERVRYYGGLRLRQLSDKAITTLSRLLSPDYEPKIRLEAARTILQGAKLLGPQSAVQINVSDNLTDAQLNEEINQLRERLRAEATILPDNLQPTTPEPLSPDTPGPGGEGGTDAR